MYGSFWHSAGFKGVRGTKKSNFRRIFGIFEMFHKALFLTVINFSFMVSKSVNNLLSQQALQRVKHFSICLKSFRTRVWSPP